MLAILCMGIASLFEGVSLGMIIPLVDNILTGRQIQLPTGSYTPSWIFETVQFVNQIPRQTLLNMIAVGLLVLFLLKELFGFCQSYLINDVSHRVMRDLRSGVYQKLLSLSLDFFHRQKTGVLMSRITGDCGVVQYCFCEGLTDLLYQPIQLVVYLVLLLGIRNYFSIPWSLVAVLIFLIPMVIYPVMRIGQRLRKISTLSQQKSGEITTALLEGISGIRIVKVFGTEFFIECYRLLTEIVGQASTVKGGEPHTFFNGRLEAAYRSAATLTFGGGVNEVQRDIIAMSALSMPPASRFANRK